MVTVKGEADGCEEQNGMMEGINKIMAMGNENSNMETIRDQDRGNS